MADRASVAIRIGGSLSPAFLPALCAAIETDGACIDWEGTPFDPALLDQRASLYLAGYDVAWGQFEAIERFCVDYHLLFARWAGGASGAFGSERAVFDGARVRSFAASDDDEILISAETVRGLGSFAAVMAHFAAAELDIPPLRMDGSNQDHR